MGILILLGNALLSIVCSILANKIEPRLDKLMQRLKKGKGSNSPK